MSTNKKDTVRKRKRSQRTKKQKKQKKQKQKQPVELKSILSKELQESLGMEDQSNLLVIDPSSKKRKKVEAVVQVGTHKKQRKKKEKKKQKMSKRKMKRFRKLEEKKRKFLIKDDLLKELSHTTLNENQLSLMRSSKSLGKSQSKKQMKKRQKLAKQQGIVLPTNRLGNSEGTNNKDTNETKNKKNLPDPNEEEKEIEMQTKREPKESTDQDPTIRLLKKKEKLSLDDQIRMIESKVQKERDLLLKSNENGKKSNNPQRNNKSKNNKGQSNKKKPTATQTKKLSQPKSYVLVDRLEEVKTHRETLPIFSEEQSIMEMISENDVVIICGETGSGKTTQVPQFLYESGYGTSLPFEGKIAITEPRRVAAVSMAKRVSYELNFKLGTIVGYKIRYENKYSKKSVLLFLTDGVLLRELQSDFFLHQYSVIIIDEAHERTLNTDILIGLLSRIVKIRRQLYEKGKKWKNSKGEEKLISPLKLIIMSATLRIKDFTRNPLLFFKKPPVKKVESRKFPVTVHFNLITPIINSYLNEAFDKICKIHTRLPPGGILVFLTGKQEIHQLCNRLRLKFPNKTVKVQEGNELMNENEKKMETEKDKENEQNEDNSDKKEKGIEDGNSNGNENEGEKKHFWFEDDEQEDENKKNIETIEDIKEKQRELELKKQKKRLNSLLRKGRRHSLGDQEEQLKDEINDDEPDYDASPVLVLPLYSTLASRDQMKVFQDPPEGYRLIVVATNVAETSITIPNIRYVVDTGKEKQKIYDQYSKISKFEIKWTSKASAEQRTGRAGRTGPGHCYRLYSSAVFQNYFPQFSQPEIKRLSIDNVVLQMKSIGLDNIIDFPFPTPPNSSSIQISFKSLKNLGAIEKDTSKINELGRNLAIFPLLPRYAKMLIMAGQSGLLPYIVRIVAGLSVREIFVIPDYNSKIEEMDDEEFDDDYDNKKKGKKKRLLEKQQKQMRNLNFWKNMESDDLGILKAIGAWMYSGCSESFCEDKCLRYKAMTEIIKLIKQIKRLLIKYSKHSDGDEDEDLQNTFDLIDDPNLRPPTKNQERLIRQILLSGFLDQVAKRNGNIDRKGLAEYVMCNSNKIVYVHPGSGLIKFQPEYVIYNEIIETSRPYMRRVTEIDHKWLFDLASPLISYGKPLEEPAPRYNAKLDTLTCFVSPIFGLHSWKLPTKEIEIPSVGDRIKYFVKDFLLGNICNELKAFAPYLNTRVELITKKIVNNSKSISLLKPFVKNKIWKKETLLKMWAKNPKFLLSQYRNWIAVAQHQKILKMWPPINDN
ncbi:hypothetical protein M0812_26238 [Anaeramoeba flamelloides]|uniref:RNA helicase n=1 Tax=Anaeramoeba flamelloides TaxID=1746091 RepID=A0AAV7YF75_9EUKA|nr:hypothetical protein M0812_26238 [Anaeramoeba flamelloides]